MEVAAGSGRSEQESEERTGEEEEEEEEEEESSEEAAAQESSEESESLEDVDSLRTAVADGAAVGGTEFTADEILKAKKKKKKKKVWFCAFFLSSFECSELSLAGPLESEFRFSDV
jgi:hypothetical protein